MRLLLKPLADKNAQTIARVVSKMLQHPGRIGIEHVRQVIANGDRLSIVSPAQIDSPYPNGGIQIQAEPINSFCPLYEVAAFTNARFLSAVVTALPVELYRDHADKDTLFDRIGKDVLALDEAQIQESFQNPKVPITIWLTDDVDARRFRKEMLWGITEASAKKFPEQIGQSELGLEVDDSLQGTLWTAQDREIAQYAIQHAETMLDAKIIQHYRTLENFFALANVALSTMPLYYLARPVSEILKMGPQSPFLNFLVEMHSPGALKKFSELSRQQNPVFIKTPCPNCGETSKYILRGRLKGPDKKTVRLICGEQEHEFKNLHGLSTLKRRGCGYKWEFQIPGNPGEIYGLLKEKGFSLHGAIYYQLQIFRNSGLSPVAKVVSDNGLYFDRDGKIKLYYEPGDYGVDPKLYVTAVALYQALLGGSLTPDFSKVMANQVLVDSPPLALAHQAPTQVFNPTRVDQAILAKYGVETSPQDESINLLLETSGMTPEEFIRRSIDLTYYPDRQLVQDLRG